MNKEITIYDLLGLIKDGKAPKIVKWEDYIFSFYNDDYLCKNEDFVKNRETNYLLCYLFSLPESALNIKVEILEEDKSIIEKIKINKYHFHNTNHSKLLKNQEILEAKLNEIIEFLSRKEDK